MTIIMKSNVLSFLERQDNKVRKQMPFAMSKSLNNTALGAVKQMKRLLPLQVDRPNPWTKRGLKVMRFAKKNSLSVVLGYNEETHGYMKHAAGADQTTKGRLSPIHTSVTSKATGGLLRKKLARLKTTGKTFIRTAPGKDPAIFLRMGTKKNPRLRLLAIISTEKRRKEIFSVPANAEAYAKLHFKRELRAAVDKAMKTAK